MAQIPLNIALSDTPSFAAFANGDNALLVAALREPAAPGIWLHGPASCGKSHLLQAASDRRDALYLALADIDDPAVLEGLADYRIIALDDVDKVAGNPRWERALFSFYNVQAAAGRCLLVASREAPLSAGIKLPDLDSRLRALAVFAVKPLDDDGRLSALRLRVAQRGLTPDARALQYLMEHTERDMGSLYDLLDQLDKASWTTGRRLTLPFIREYLRDV